MLGKKKIEDEVHFNLTEYRLQSSRMRSVLAMAFGADANEIRVPRNAEKLDIVCRPDQFARFLIMRDRAGLNNGFKELEPRLVPVGPKTGPLDVTDRESGISEGVYQELGTY